MSSERNKLTSMNWLHFDVLHVAVRGYIQAWPEIDWWAWDVSSTEHIANLWRMTPSLGGTGIAESLQHCIRTQSSAPSVYGRLTSQNLPCKEEIELWVLKLWFCNILLLSVFKTTPSTLLLVPFPDCLGEGLRMNLLWNFTQSHYQFGVRVKINWPNISLDQISIWRSLEGEETEWCGLPP